MDSPFRKLTQQWLAKVKAAKDQKKEFSRDGEECLKFFRGPYDFMYGLKEGVPQSGDFIFVGEPGHMPRPSVAMTLNKVAECVQIFGPTLYHRNPIRKVNPRMLPSLPPEAFGDPNDPNVQQMVQQMMGQVQQQRGRDQTRASLLQWYQDMTPTATDLKTESRQAIDEALIFGMGVLWPQVWQPPAFPGRIVASCFDSVIHLLIDSDMEHRKKAKWVGKICTIPVWEFEAKFRLPPGTVKGTAESYSQREFLESEGGYGEMARRQGKSNDLITYYEIYSKMGMGTLLSGSVGTAASYSYNADIDPENKQIDRFGQYCYLVVCKELDYPANLPKEIWNDEQAIRQAVQWPVPYWADDAWPFAELVIHDVPNQVWPMSHFKPAMGELKFLNWAASFLATRMKKSARDLLVIDKAASEEMRRALLSGEDFELVELSKSHNKTIKEVVEVLQFPNVNGDVFKVIEWVTHLFEQRTGLSELMYGESAHQYRSAEEANVKGQQLHTRTDDMVNKTEDWMSQVARMEALCARWELDPQKDIAPIGGPVYAQWWQQFITPSDPTEILHQIEYRIEANSARKPNRDKDMADADSAMQQLFPVLVEIAKSGQTGPANALITKWAESHQWDASQFILPGPPPPPPPPPDKPKISVAVDFATLDPGTKQAIWQLAGVQAPPQEPAADNQAQQAQEMALEQQKHAMEMQAQQVKVEQERQYMAHKEAHHQQTLRHAQEKHKNDLKLAEEKAKQKPQGSK
jgi:hypothetical protein